MAAPAEKTIKDLTGKWSLNKTLSDDSDPVLALQGVSYLLRLGISVATIDLQIKQYAGPANPGNDSTDSFTHVDIVQTALKVSSTNEDRCVDGVERPHADKIFGSVESKSWWTKVDELDDEFLKQGWLAEGELLATEARSVGKGWVARQVWGFKDVKGERRYARNVVVTKGAERVSIVLVYNYDGPL